MPLVRAPLPIRPRVSATVQSFAWRWRMGREKIAPHGATTKRTHKYVRWQPYMVDVLHRHPDMEAAELAELMGLTVESVRSARKRFGRFGKGTRGLCIVCDSRPVWAESAKAKRMGLCKGCYLTEMRKRDEERREHAAQRQYRHRTRGRA